MIGTMYSIPQGGFALELGTEGLTVLRMTDRSTKSNHVGGTLGGNYFLTKPEFRNYGT
jgi:hypothetical protein